MKRLRIYIDTSVAGGCLDKEFTKESNALFEAAKMGKVVLSDLLFISGKSQINDAHHVAIATIFSADIIVSWNFKHIVHLNKIRGFNSINIREGYKELEIRNPKEVI